MKKSRFPEIKFSDGVKVSKIQYERKIKCSSFLK